MFHIFNNFQFSFFNFQLSIVSIFLSSSSMFYYHIFGIKNQCKITFSEYYFIQKSHFRLQRYYFFFNYASNSENFCLFTPKILESSLLSPFNFHFSIFNHSFTPLLLHSSTPFNFQLSIFNSSNPQNRAQRYK